MVNAIVLAGSPNNGPLKEASPAAYEALIDIGGRAMCEYVIEALLAVRRVQKIAVVGPAAAFPFPLEGRKVFGVPSTGDLMDNIAAGLARTAETERVLIATSDIPLLTAGAVDDFLDLCGDASLDLYYPVIEKRVVEGRFPSTRRTYVRLKDGIFTGGNLFLLNPAVFPQCREKGKEFIALRKNPLGLCRLLGIVFVVKFLLHTLSLAEAERKVSQLLGIRGAVVVSRYPEIGVDVDKPEDLKLVLEQMSKEPR